MLVIKCSSGLSIGMNRRSFLLQLRLSNLLWTGENVHMYLCSHHINLDGCLLHYNSWSNITQTRGLVSVHMYATC